MKTGRRVDSRDRDFAMGRYRKRPSMLSEFHGKHYNARELERSSCDGPYFRPHNRYGYEPPSTMEYDRYGPGFHKSKMIDPRRHPYAHHYSRSAYHYHQQNAHYHNDLSNADYTHDEEIPPKRPRLYVDVTRQPSSQFDAPNSADSVASSSNLGSVTSAGAQNVEPIVFSPPPQVTGLSAFLEDIDSDDDIMKDEEEEKSLAKSPMEPPSSSPGRPSKEELLMMMERVDRDIAASEGQMATLQKKHAGLVESENAPLPRSSLPSATTPSPKPLSPDLSSSDIEDETLGPSPAEERRPSPKRSLMETIYTENRMKARNAQAVLTQLNFSPVPAHSVIPLYHQPSETPHYHNIIERHETFRPRLVECIRKRKVARHKKELQLCEQYDAHMAEWERRIDKIESSSKKKSREAKNRELFEKFFPELKARREQQERFNRVDQRGFGVVRSDAELKELMYELYEQEEAPVRYQRTRATIPPMVIDKREEGVRFHSTNGLIADPMALYRESKFTNMWTDEEKRLFREKYLMYSKNFEMIASFLPNKSTSDCVKYYYLSKKNEKFKQLVRKVTIKRRNPSSGYRIHPPVSLSSPHPSLVLGEKPKPEALPIVEEAELPSKEGNKPDYGSWTEEEIAGLKEGLRKYGRAWGKIYREVGDQKTATQCKQFYDDFCNDELLDLNQALEEHSSMKNAERITRKARKPMPAVSTEVKHKKTKAPSPEDAVDSENTDSASETEHSGNESETESTQTDSSRENTPSQPPHQATRSNRKKTNFVQRRTSEEALDLFIIAAEALNKIVPLEVALHDHTYARPPNSLMNSVDLQGTSGLSLIAAAAAVVSPTLSRSAGSGKLASLSPVRAPRGRPPNSQKRGNSSSSSKLAPTLLSPAGSCSSVLLTDVKTPTLRGRTRSAPTDRPRASTFQFPRTPNLARISMSSGNRSIVGGTRGIMPPASYSRQKDLTGASSLKSMIASQPQQASDGSNARFEALVNVAVAASPAELPKTSANAPATSTVTFPSLSLQTSTVPSSVSSHSTPTTPINAYSYPQSKDGGTNTAILDVSQAINILALASLAGQQAPSACTTQSPLPLSAQPLLAQAPMLQGSHLLDSVASQSNPVTVIQGTNESDISSTNQVASSLPGATTSVDTLMGQLAAASTGAASRAEMPMTAGANSSEGSPLLNSSLSYQSPIQPVSLAHPASSSESISSSLSQVLHTSCSTANGDDLSNLNLLSSLVAAVASSQPSTSSFSSSSTSSTGNMHTSAAPLSTASRPHKSNFESDASSVSSLGAQDGLTHSHIPAALRSEQLLEGNTPVTFEQRKVDRTVNEVDLSRPSHKDDPHRGTLHSSPEHSGEDLASSVMRTSMTTLAQDSSLKLPHYSSDTLSTHNTVRPSTHTHNSTNDITASLASIIPNPLSYPSISQQSTLLLYTHSLSFPLSASSEPSPEEEEEDHLESATRGISELSKLLGTDTGTDATSTNKESSRYKGMAAWNPNELLTHPSSLALRTPYGGSGSIASNPSSFPKAEFPPEPSSKSFLSNLLESHSTVHRTPSPSSLGNTNTNNSNSDLPFVNHDGTT